MKAVLRLLNFSWSLREFHGESSSSESICRHSLQRGQDRARHSDEAGTPMGVDHARIGGGSVSGTQLKGGQTDVQLNFNGMYLGPLHELLDIVYKSFPEMGMVSSDCKETTWIGSISYTAYTNRAELCNRYNSNKGYLKGKLDFVKSPILPSAWHGAWKFLEELPGNSYVLLDPLGGIMDQILPFAIPFPHRVGNLHSIQYQITWNDPSEDAESIAWIRRLYQYMAPYVSNSPKAAYVNYLELDLGVAPNGTATVEEGRL